MTTVADRIETLRVAWERDLERIFAAQPHNIRSERLDRGARDPRVRLGKTMAKRVHHIARAAAERLGCTEPFDLYQTPSERRHLTAQLLISEQPFAVRLVGPVAGALDDAALAMLIGHELGHWMALGPWANPPSILLEAWERGASPHVVRLCTLACELTADRFALVAAGGELEAAVRLDVAIATFDSPRALGLEELDYLAELRQCVEGGEDKILSDDGYPTSAFRLYATWLFWRTDIHQILTGIGPGDLALSDVDARLQAICAERFSWPSVRDGLSAPASEMTARAGAVTEAPNLLADIPHAAQYGAAALTGYVRTAASSVRSTLGRFLDSKERDRGAATNEDDSADSDSGFDETDDLERRFRALEAESMGDARAKTQPSLDDLEARFRELEERERNAR